MKINLKSGFAVLLVLAGLSISCKKNETVPAETNDTYADSSAVVADTISTVPADTVGTDTSKTMTPPPAK